MLAELGSELKTIREEELIKLYADKKDKEENIRDKRVAIKVDEEAFQMSIKNQKRKSSYSVKVSSKNSCVWPTW